MFDAAVLFVFYLYGIPLFLINLRTIYVMRTNKIQFNSSYYFIFFCAGLNDCVLYLLNNYAIRFPSIQLFFDLYFSKWTEYSQWQMPIIFLRRYCSYATNFGPALLSLNRLTAILTYQRHEKLWENTKPFWMIFLFGGPFLFSFQELFNSAKFYKSQVGNTTIVQITSSNYFNPIESKLASIPVIATFMTFGITANMLAFAFWRQRKSQIPTKYRNYELKLLWMTAINYGLALITLFYHSFLLLFTLDAFQQYVAYLIVSDSVALIPSLVILFMSPTLRDLVFPYSMFNGLCSAYKNGLLPGSSIVSMPSTHKHDNQIHQIRHMEIGEQRPVSIIHPQGFNTMSNPNAMNSNEGF